MEIAKFKSIALEQIHGFVLSAGNAFTQFWQIVAKGFQHLRCQSGEAMKKLGVWSREAMVFARPKLTLFWSQAFLATKWATRSLAGSLQKSRQTLIVMGAGASNTLHKVGSASAKALRKLRTSSHEAAVAASGNIARLGRQVSATTKQLVVSFQKAQTAIVGLGKSVADQPRRQREARCAQENGVRELLVGSPDAVVLTDDEKRLVAANPTALNLFGISEFNLRNFTIDAFVTQNPFPRLEGNSLTFRRDSERRSQCKIRRLDGCLQSAECVFVAHALPHQHLYKFLNAAPYRITPLGFTARNAGRSTSRVARQT